jgi:hypothetical protein
VTEAEQRRYEQGRADWRECDWQDHCGDYDCQNCDGALIPFDDRRAALRRSVFILPHPTEDQ